VKLTVSCCRFDLTVQKVSIHFLQTVKIRRSKSKHIFLQIVKVRKNLNFSKFSTELSSHNELKCSALSSTAGCIQRGGGFTQAGVSQRFGRVRNFQIPTKLSAGIHPRLRETARYCCNKSAFFIVS